MVAVAIAQPRRAARRRTLRRRRVAALSAVVVVAAAFGAALTAIVASLVLAAGPGAPGGGPLTASGSPSAGIRPAAARTWVVQPGDTLWTIVERSGVRGDPRPVVDRLNAELHGRPLQAGERITLPSG